MRAKDDAHTRDVDSRFCSASEHWPEAGNLVLLCRSLHLACSCSNASRAVSGESVAEPGALLTGANSSSLRTSSSAGRCAQGNVSKMNCSSLIPCSNPDPAMPYNATFVEPCRKDQADERAEKHQWFALVGCMAPSLAHRRMVSVSAPRGRQRRAVAAAPGREGRAR